MTGTDGLRNLRVSVVGQQRPAGVVVPLEARALEVQGPGRGRDVAAVPLLDIDASEHAGGKDGDEEEG